MTCLVVASAAVARAEAPVRLQTVEPLPFSPDELEQAVGARLGMGVGAEAALVVVGPADDAGVHLRAAERSAIVPIGERAGVAAARLVALAIADLAAEPQPQPPPPVSARASAPAPAPPVIAARPAALPPVAAPPRSPPRISVTVEGSKGTDATEPFTFGFLADLVVPRRGYDLAAALGVWDVPTRRAGLVDETSFVAGVVRLGAGWHAGHFQLLAGPFAAPYRLEGGVSRTGVLAGAGAVLRVSRAVGPRVQLFGSLRVDAFANRVRVSLVGGDPSFASPRVAGALGVGLSWDLGL